MTSLIQAIETNYAGCRFRSRLEARWAVFFDHARLLRSDRTFEWAYEPANFRLANGYYIPDFRTRLIGPDGFLEEWFEVKGQPPTDREKLLAQELAVVTNSIVRIVTNTPHPGEQCQAWRSHSSLGYMVPDEDFPRNNSTWRVAYTAASSARFEHGHSGCFCHQGGRP
jgi:hypothetical protein